MLQFCLKYCKKYGAKDDEDPLSMEEFEKHLVVEKLTDYHGSMNGNITTEGTKRTKYDE